MPTRHRRLAARRPVSGLYYWRARHCCLARGTQCWVASVLRAGVGISARIPATKVLLLGLILRFQEV
jgi:hypothetical protein